jgi:beta-lactamase regulating signal transducer with metallopeptidase domain
MDSILDAALRNAALAVPLAALVLILGFVLRRPALLHVLWIAVLLRLVMPPVWNVNVPRPAEPAVTEDVAAPIRGESPDPAELVQADTQVAPEENAPSIWWQLVPEAKNDAAPTAEPGAELPAPVNEPPAAEQASQAIELPSWHAVVGWIWLAGSALLAALTVVRLGQFMLALRAAAPAVRAIQVEVDSITARLGLRRVPRVLLMDARVSPMLWGFFGRPRLILPAALWANLTPSQRSTLLAHELAHYSRGDHWVRWLELAATVLFWWHPVVWLARKRLREAEEQCCDAWVIWALPESRRDYATAIVDTVGFLSTGRPGLPALASGVGEIRHLRRRLTMIMRDNPSRRLPRLALAALFGGGLALGGLAPTWGQDRREPPPAERRDDERRGERGDRRDEPTPEERRRGERVRAEGDRAREEARAELERARADFERARQRLEELERRLNQRDPERRREAPTPREENRGEPGRPALPGVPATPAPPALPRGPQGFAPANMERRLDALERRLEEVTRLLEEMRRGGGGGRGPGPGGRGAGAGRGSGSGDSRPGSSDRDGPDVPTPPTPPTPPTEPRRSR